MSAHCRGRGPSTSYICRHSAEAPLDNYVVGVGFVLSGQHRGWNGPTLHRRPWEGRPVVGRVGRCCPIGRLGSGSGPGSARTWPAPSLVPDLFDIPPHLVLLVSGALVSGHVRGGLPAILVAVALDVPPCAHPGAPGPAGSVVEVHADKHLPSLVFPELEVIELVVVQDSLFARGGRFPLLAVSDSAGLPGRAVVSGIG